VSLRSAFTFVIYGRNRDWGLARVTYARVMRVLHWLFGFRLNAIYVGAARPDTLRPDRAAIPEGYTSRICSREAFLPDLLAQNYVSEELLDREFGNDDVAVGAYYQGKLVAYQFITRQRVRLTEQLDAIVPAGFRTSYRGWTHPDHRRKNLSYNLGYTLQKYCWEIDFNERVIWYIESHNFASRLHHYRNPREWSLIMGYFGWFRFFGKQIPFNSRWATRIGFIAVRKGAGSNKYYSN